MPVFQDTDNRPPRVIIEPCDAIFCVTKFGSAYTQKSTAKVPSGTLVYQMELEIEGKNCIVEEDLYDIEAAQWRLDTFLKSAGVQLAKGEAFEFSKAKADEAFVKHVNPIGLRGWCHVKKQPWTNQPGKFSNEIGIFYTDKPKLPRREIADDINY